MNKIFKNISETSDSFLRGVGSTMSVFISHEKRKSSSDFLESFNDHLKELHKGDDLYRRCDYNNPSSIGDYWEDTGKFLFWAMSDYNNEQEENHIQKQ